MSTWKKFVELIQALRAGASLGDLAVIKFEMLSGGSDDLNARLRSLPHACLDVKMSDLRALPDGTVGREYARFLDQRGLRPLDVSESVRARFADRPYALRYTTTHDLFHVLTGFPTTPAGEMGLFAFMIAQGFAGGSRARLWMSVASYALFMPLHTPGAVHNTRVGIAMGKKAKPLLEEPLEAYLSEPLDAVRRRLGLPDPSVAGIAPGHESLLSSWFLPKEPARVAASSS